MLYHLQNNITQTDLYNIKMFPDLLDKLSYTLISYVCLLPTSIPCVGLSATLIPYFGLSPTLIPYVCLLPTSIPCVGLSSTLTPYAGLSPTPIPYIGLSPTPIP